MATELETAWAAGLFEGEGCFYIATPSGEREGRWRVQNAYLGMCDFDSVRRFAAIVDCGTLTERKFEGQRGHWKPQLMWRCSGESAVGVAKMLRPFLGERRSERANELIESFDDERVKWCRSCGFSYVASRSDQRACSEKCADRLRRGPGDDEQTSLFYKRGNDFLPYEAMRKAGA